MTHCRSARPAPLRIALTGGPGGGKSTALDLFQRELGSRVVAVPEVATLLFRGGFPRSSDAQARRCAQAAIYHVQKQLEEAHRALHPSRALICDRGTVDAAAYWPEDAGDFFVTVGSTARAELSRYDHVLFFESAAIGGHGLGDNNPSRTETGKEAVAVDAKLRALWSAHPRFTLVPHDASFLNKISAGLTALQAIFAERPLASGD